MASTLIYYNTVTTETVELLFDDNYMGASEGIQGLYMHDVLDILRSHGDTVKDIRIEQFNFEEYE